MKAETLKIHLMTVLLFTARGTLRTRSPANVITLERSFTDANQFNLNMGDESAHFILFLNDTFLSHQHKWKRQK